MLKSFLNIISSPFMYRMCLMKICSRLKRLSKGVEENIFMTFVDIKQSSGQLLAYDDRHYVFKGYKIMNRLI